MNTQMMICMVIFAATLISYMLNKIPMWLTAMISLTALYFTGCIDANGAMAGFSNVNTILMATMFIVAAGFPPDLSGGWNVQRHYEADKRKLSDRVFWLYSHCCTVDKLHRKPDGCLRDRKSAAGSIL